MWNYRILKKEDTVDGQDYYFLTEVFYESKTNRPMAYADEEMIMGDSPSEIIAVLEMMLKDAKKDLPILTEDDFKA